MFFLKKVISEGSHVKFHTFEPSFRESVDMNSMLPIESIHVNAFFSSLLKKVLAEGLYMLIHFVQASFR